jgi:adenylyl-sulfate kinase
LNRADFRTKSRRSIRAVNDNPAMNAKRIVVPIVGKVSPQERASLLGQRPVTVWLTGFSAAGKSTLASELERRLIDASRPCYLLDGDNIRAGISRDLGFGPEDRHENIRRIAEVARLMNEAGLVAITAFISPYRSDRAMAREVVGTHRFIEVHVAAPLEVCEKRDPKGLYAKARRGEIADFTGVSAPYEAPESPDLVLETAQASIDACVQLLFDTVISEIKPH